MEIRLPLTLDQKVMPEVELLVPQHEEVNKFFSQEATRSKLDILSETTISELWKSPEVCNKVRRVNS